MKTDILDSMLLRAFKLLMSLLSGLVLSAAMLTTTSHAALFAKTANTIQGTAPYLTFDGGTTKVTNMDGLLGIELSDGTRYTVLTNTSSPSNPIELPVANQTFSDIKTSIPATLTSVNLSTLIGAPYNRFGDADGDGQGEDGVNVTGTLSVSLKDVNNKKVNLTDTLEGCKSYYTLTLTSTAGTLSTQYGSPNSSNFTASNTTYYIKPKLNAPYVCYAKPNLENNYRVYQGTTWDDTKGFIVPYPLGEAKSNFPRTGANGLFFDMMVAGELAENVIAANESSAGSGEVNATSGAANIKLKLSVSPSAVNVVRIMLSGPSSGFKVGQPGPADVNMPTMFNLYSDAAKTNKIYSFELSKWFIAKPETSQIFYYKGTDNASGQSTPQYCESLGSYRVPSVLEYTNVYPNNWLGRFQPVHSIYERYGRMIGNGQRTEIPPGGWKPEAKREENDDGVGGLFTEWGNTISYFYPDADFDGSYYWGAESSLSLYYADGVGVFNYDGRVAGLPSYNYIRAACVTP